MVTVVSASAVREAAPRDFEAIRVVAAAANEEFRAPMGDALFDGYLANVLDVEGRAAAAVVLVAERHGAVVGTITVYRDIHDEGMPVSFPPHTAGIRATAVSPSARGHGIGSQLVEAGIATARALGARALALHTADYMTAAARLYERHGFRRLPDHDYRANDFFGAPGGNALHARAFLLPLDR